MAKTKRAVRSTNQNIIQLPSASIYNKIVLNVNGEQRNENKLIINQWECLTFDDQLDSELDDESDA